MKSLLIFLIFFLPYGVSAQLEPLTKYDDLMVYKKDITYSLYKIKGKKYQFYDNYIIKKKDTIYTIETDDIIYYMIYKKRYLFVSYYPIEQQSWSYGFEYRKLTKLHIIDLEKPNRKWQYNFESVEAKSKMRLGLGDISDFIPETGEIVFTVKFSVNTSGDVSW